MPRITPVHYRKLKKVFERDGWQYLGNVGDHMQFRKPGYLRRVVIPTLQLTRKEEKKQGSLAVIADFNLRSFERTSTPKAGFDLLKIPNLDLW